MERFLRPWYQQVLVPQVLPRCEILPTLGCVQSIIGRVRPVANVDHVDQLCAHRIHVNVMNEVKQILE
jgi:hypothetical protein